MVGAIKTTGSSNILNLSCKNLIVDIRCNLNYLTNQGETNEKLEQHHFFHGSGWFRIELKTSWLDCQCLVSDIHS